MIGRFEFWVAILMLTIMLYSNHNHAEEAACLSGSPTACGKHFW